MTAPFSAIQADFSQSACTQPAALPIVWTISGLDSGGGAGSSADVKACEALQVHVCPVIAAITAQHSLAVEHIEPVQAALLDKQLAALAADMPPAVIKTGMLGSPANVLIVAQWVKRLRQAANQQPVLLVIDPVLQASTGAALASHELLQVMRSELLPLADVITPNQREARALLGLQAPLSKAQEIEQAAQALQALGCRSVVITGGDLPMPGAADRAQDYVASRQMRGWLSLPRVKTHHNHGTGCVFAASIAAALAHGFCEADAIILGKMATTQALQRAYPAGQGAGPVRPGIGASQRIELLPRLYSHHDAAANQLAIGQSVAHLPQQAFTPLSAQELAVYAIVDSPTAIERALQAGAKTLQLRIKTPDLNHADLRLAIQTSIQLARHAEAQLFINDHWQLALELGAYGVHLGQEDLFQADLAALQQAGLRLGISSHSYWEVCRAWTLQPSYIACGPLYATDSKAMPWSPQGPDNLAYWCHLLPVPVVGIGGLNAPRIAQARQCQAQGAAVISALTHTSNWPQTWTELSQAWAEGARQPAWPSPLLPHPTLAASRHSDLRLAATAQAKP